MQQLVCFTSSITCLHRNTELTAPICSALSADQPLRPDPWTSRVLVSRLLPCAVVTSASCFLLVLASYRRFTLCRRDHGNGELGDGAKDTSSQRNGSERGKDEARGGHAHGAGMAGCEPLSDSRAVTPWNRVPFAICVGPFVVQSCAAPYQMVAATGWLEGVGSVTQKGEDGYALLGSLGPPPEQKGWRLHAEAEARVEIEVEEVEGQRRMVAQRWALGVSRGVVGLSSAAGLFVSSLAGYAVMKSLLRHALQREVRGSLTAVSCLGGGAGAGGCKDRHCGSSHERVIFTHM